MLHWFALHVRPNTELKVVSSLAGQIELFWPHTERIDDHNRSTRRSWFPGYLFVRFNYDEDAIARLRLLMLPQLVGMVAVSGKPAVIPEHEIESLRILERQGVSVGHVRALEIGEYVRVVKGPLTGCEGEVVELRNGHHLIVNVPMLGRGVSTQIDPGSVEPVARRRLHSAA